MTIAIVQAAQLFNAFTGSFGSPVTAGNTIVLLASCYNASGATISSSAPLYNGSTPSGSAKLKDLQSPIAGGDSVYCAIWMMPDVAGGGTSVGLTVTNGGNVSSTGLIALEVSGLGSSPSLDQSASDSGNSTDPTSGTTGAITAAPELVVAIDVQFAVSLTAPGSPWTTYQAGADYTAFGHQVVASSGGTYAYACTSSSSAPWSGVIATIQGTAASGVSGTVGVAMAPMAQSLTGAAGASGTLGLAAAPMKLSATASAGTAVSGTLGVAMAPMRLSAAAAVRQNVTGTLAMALAAMKLRLAGPPAVAQGAAQDEDEHAALVKLRLLRGWWP